MSLVRRGWRVARSVAWRVGVAGDGGAALARRIEGLLDGPLRDRWRASDVPGLQCAVVLRDGRRLVRSWGLADREAGAAFVPSTVVQVMSITKTLIAATCVEMARLGRVDLDAPVWRYFDDWRLASGGGFDVDGVTLRRLLCHRAGINIHGIGWAPRGAGPVATMDLLHSRGPDLAMEPIRLLFEPGTRTQYSGAGYAIVQHAIESIMRRPIAEVVREVLLSPLRMEGTGFLPSAALETRLSRRYARDARGVLQPTPVRALSCDASSGVLSTLEDLCTFARGVVERIDGDWRELAMPQGPVDGRRAAGLGFHLWVTRSDTTLAHRGYHGGYWHEVIVFARRKVAIVVVSNGDEEERTAKPIATALRECVMEQGVA